MTALTGGGGRGPLELWDGAADRNRRSTSDTTPRNTSYLSPIDYEWNRLPPLAPFRNSPRKQGNSRRALTRYLDDGRLEIDNNLAENALRPVCLGWKNYLFAGSDDGCERAALLDSLVTTCKLNEIDPYANLSDLMARITDHPTNRIAELLPFNWTKIAQADAT